MNQDAFQSHFRNNQFYTWHTAQLSCLVDHYRGEERVVAKYWQNVNITETIKTVLCQYPSNQNSIFIMSFIKNERKQTEAALGMYRLLSLQTKDRLGRWTFYLFKQILSTFRLACKNYYIKDLSTSYSKTNIVSKERTVVPQEAHPNKTFNKRYRLQRLFKRGAGGNPHTSEPDYQQVYLDNRKNNKRGCGMKEKESEISQHQGQLCLNYLNLIL